MGRALGLPAGGNDFPRFLATKTIAPLLGGEIAQKIAQPLKFQWDTAGGEQPPGIRDYAFDVCS